MNAPFWSNVKRVMKDKDITQQKLADYLQLSVRTVQGWFHKDIDFNVDGACVIAKFLGCSLDDLCEISKTPLRQDEYELLNIYNQIPEDYRNIALIQLKALLPLKDLD